MAVFEKNEVLIKDNIENYPIKIGVNLPKWLYQFDSVTLDDQFIEPSKGVNEILLERQYNIEEKRVTSYFHNQRQPVTMQGVENSSNIIIEFDPHKTSLMLHEISIIRHNTQKLNAINGADFHILKREYGAESNIYLGIVSLSIVLEKIKINDIIEIKYSLINTSPIECQNYSTIIQTQYGIPIQKYNLAIITTKKDSIAYKTFKKDIQFKEITNGENFISSYTENKLPTTEPESYTPHWYPAYPVIQIGKKNKWIDIVTQQKSFYRHVTIHEEKLIKFINNLKNSTSTKHDKVIAIINYINNNIRYLSNYRTTDNIAPTDPNVTANRMYGDCKDLVYLMHNLLNELNIQSYPVLVNTDLGKAVNNFLPSLIAFNHAIILIHVAQKAYFLDLTIRQKINHLSRSFIPDYGYGLTIKDEVNELIYIKNEFYNSNKITIEDIYDIKTRPPFPLITSYKSIVHFEGSQALAIKDALENQKESLFWEKLRGIYKKAFSIDHIFLEKIENREAINNTVTLEMHYRITPNRFVSQGNNCKIELYPIRILGEFFIQLPKKVNADFYYGDSITIDYKINFMDPKIKLFNFKDDTISDKNFFLSRKKEFTKTEKSITYLFSKIKDVIPSQHYNTFLENNLQAKEILYFIIEKKRRSLKYLIYPAIALSIFLLLAILGHF